jgi:hypothetical protein
MGRLLRSLRSCPAMTESFRPNQNFVGYVRGLSIIIFSAIEQNAEDCCNKGVRRANGKRGYFVAHQRPKRHSRSAQQVAIRHTNGCTRRSHVHASCLYDAIDLEDIIRTTCIRPYTIAPRSVAAPGPRQPKGQRASPRLQFDEIDPRGPARRARSGLGFDACCKADDRRVRSGLTDVKRGGCGIGIPETDGWTPRLENASTRRVDFWDSSLCTERRTKSAVVPPGKGSLFHPRCPILPPSAT